MVISSNAAGISVLFLISNLANSSLPSAYRTHFPMLIAHRTRFPVLIVHRARFPVLIVHRARFYFLSTS